MLEDGAAPLEGEEKEWRERRRRCGSRLGERWIRLGLIARIIYRKRFWVVGLVGIGLS